MSVISAASSAAVVRERPALPASASTFGVNLVGVALFIVAALWCREQQLIRIEAALVACLAYALPILAHDGFRVWQARRAPGANAVTQAFDAARIATKLAGLYAAYAVIAFAYWLFPEYRGAPYQAGLIVLREVMPWVAVLAIPYVALTDRFMSDPHDGCWYAGRAVLLRRDPAGDGAVLQFALGWVVKGFFWPLMFSALATNMDSLMRLRIDIAAMPFEALFQSITTCLYTLDVLTAAVGYAAAFRLLGTHIRSTEPTKLGWAVCLMCYPPFLTVFMTQYLAFNSQNAIRLLSGLPTLQIIWGCLCIAVLTVYALASVAYGCRFSNITHRGIITDGLYRFTKHPAYVSKTLFWWMLHVPFYPASSAGDALRYTILLAGITVVYYLRARTEERHLSHDPDYVAYALAMNERSVFRGIARRLPFLIYRAPEGWQSLPAPYEKLPAK